MSYFQRILSALRGVLTILLAVILFFAPKESYELIAIILSFSLMIYGFKMLWYYFSMARHMVGGKNHLYQAVIVLDVALVTLSIATMSEVVIIAYLLFIFAFTGFIDVMRAMESKKLGASKWRFKMTVGILHILFAIILLIVGIILHQLDIMVYGYCISLVFSGATRIANAFRRTAIVYIQ